MNRKNRLAVWLCLVLTVLMVVSAIPAGAISVSVVGVTTPAETVNTPNSAGEIEVNTGNPALDDSVPVGNPGEGYTPVGTAINSTEDFNNMDPNGKYYLATDIAVSKTYAGFAGVFDGNGNTVTTTVPLFNAPQSATIKNLVVEGNVATVNNANVGAVASGTSFDCNFFNILNKANVRIPDDATGTEHRASGIAGRTSGYTIFERCTNEGTITGNSISAGITALASADESSEAVFIKCVNTGVITTSASGAGGIVAGAECPNGVMLFYNCRNEAAITGRGSAGGIIAYTTNSLGVASVRLVNCTNIAVITASEGPAGGMIGISNAQNTIENCTNEATGKIYAGPKSTNNQRQAGGILGSAVQKTLISGCKNYADVEGAGQSGGIVGMVNSTDATIQNCQNTGAVTSRLNYAGGIAARVDTGGDFTKGEVNNVIADCTNEGNVSSYKAHVAGIIAYSMSPVTIIRCTNKGNVSARSDTPDNISMNAGGIAGSFECELTITDCTNNGNVSAKANYTVSEDGTVTAQSGGTAGGILAVSGNGIMKGVTRVTGCVNTGAVKSGEAKISTVANNTMYAGGIVGYQYGGGSATYLMVSYCINTGDVTAASDASYVLGYANLPYAVITCNVLAGKLTSTCFPEGVNASGSSVLNALFWNNASTLPEEYYSNNWVVDTFEGTLINNLASTGEGTPVGMGGYAYTFQSTDDPFEIMDLFVKEASPRDTATLITSADEFLAMSPIGNYKLAENIVLNAVYDKYFLGTFDGDNHTITLNGSAAFSNFGAGAVISNVTLAGTVSHTDTTGALGRWTGATFINIRNTANVTAAKNAGGVIGSTAGNPSRFVNCVNTGTISSANGENAGGICGYVNGITTRFVNCSNSGTVTAKTNAAGIAGCNVAEANYATYINCTNSGAVTGAKHAGGIVGESQTSIAANPMYQGCVNTGKITTTATSGTVGAGGIQGYNGTAKVYLQDCYNDGEVSGPYAGGMIGDSAKGTIVTSCVNSGAITSTVTAAGGIANHHPDAGAEFTFTNCVNTGTISGKGVVGGITGTIMQIVPGKNVVFTSCINTGKIIGSSDTGGIGGKFQLDNNTTDSNTKANVVMTNCVNVGDISSSGVNVGALIGYAWASDRVGVNVQNCIVAGTVTSTGNRAGAICGYANTTLITFKNNVIAATVTAKVSTHLYYATGASALTASSNIANNFVKPGSAMYDTQKGHGETKIDLGANSTGSVAVNDFAIDSTATGNLLLAVGIAPTTDGKYGNALQAIFGGAEKNSENKVAVYNAAGELVATVSTLTEVSKYLTEGATVKLLANYYAGMYDNIYGNGISYTFDGNGFGFYSANTGKYMLNFSGSGSVDVVNLEVYAQGHAVRVGLNRRAAALNVNFTNAKIYAGSANENGYIRSTLSATALYNVAPYAVINIKGDQTAFKNAYGIQIQSNDGVMNIEDGTYTTNDIALETWGQDPVVNINGGTFSGDKLIDNSLITCGRGTININGGKFTNTGMCVVRVLGGKTQKEFDDDNTIITATNAQLNIYDGEFVLAAGYDGWYAAVLRCGGGSSYGSVLITGGTFVNQKTEKSEQVIFKNNTCSSLTITGGKFLASAKQTYFVRTNGCANVELDGYRPTDSHTNRATSAYSGTYTYNGASYKIWTLYGATDSNYAMTTESGAQVRMTLGSTGLRFISTITADKIAAAKKLAGDKGSVSYGTVIAPLDYVLRADAFTMAALDEALTDIAAEKRYVDIKAVDGLTEDEDGNVEIRAALTNIRTSNLTRAFAAVSYVKVVDGGNTTYYYSAFDAVENVRAIRQVAEAALADTKETQEGAYIYAILDDEDNVIAYSRYSDSERAVLKTFVA